jgi:hypothetical protein
MIHQWESGIAVDGSLAARWKMVNAASLITMQLDTIRTGSRPIAYLTQAKILRKPL